MSKQEKIVHVVLMILPVALVAYAFFAPSSAPRVLSGVALFIAAMVAVVNRLAVPPWAKEDLVTLSTELNQVAGPGAAAKVSPRAALFVVRRKMSKIPPLALLACIFYCVIAISAACSASPTQVSQTEEDAFKLAGCVLAQVFGGDTDPAMIGSQCIGALPAVIVDIINDFEAQHGDASAAAALQFEQPTQHALLEDAKKNALAVLAQKANSK